MSDTITITVRPFRMGTEKDAALKPLEEAAEVYAEWQRIEMWRRAVNPEPLALPIIEPLRTALANELADCITACCNLADRYALDIQAAIDRVEQSNRERGRYA